MGFPRKILSSSTTDLGRFRCSNIWLDFCLCFPNIWFPASIIFGYCSFKRSFCSNKKTWDDLFCVSKDGFCVCPVNISEDDESWICSGFRCVFSVALVFCSTDVWSWIDSVLFSIWILILWVSPSDGVFEFELTSWCLYETTIS